jgi:hypothetical protein
MLATYCRVPRLTRTPHWHTAAAKMMFNVRDLETDKSQRLKAMTWLNLAMMRILVFMR